MPEGENRWIVGVSTIRRREGRYGVRREGPRFRCWQRSAGCVHFYRGKYTFSHSLSLSVCLLVSLSVCVCVCVCLLILPGCTLNPAVADALGTRGSNHRVSLWVCAFVRCCFFAGDDRSEMFSGGRFRGFEMLGREGDDGIMNGGIIDHPRSGYCAGTSFHPRDMT